MQVSTDFGGARVCIRIQLMLVPIGFPVGLVMVDHSNSTTVTSGYNAGNAWMDPCPVLQCDVLSLQVIGSSLVHCISHLLGSQCILYLFASGSSGISTRWDPNSPLVSSGGGGLCVHMYLHLCAKRLQKS